MVSIFISEVIENFHKIYFIKESIKFNLLNEINLFLQIYNNNNNIYMKLIDILIKNIDILKQLDIYKNSDSFVLNLEMVKILFYIKLIVLKI